jgi:hypothetical protein
MKVSGGAAGWLPPLTQRIDVVYCVDCVRFDRTLPLRRWGQSVVTNGFCPSVRIGLTLLLASASGQVSVFETTLLPLKDQG